jgi:hypothetical protein
LINKTFAGRLSYLIVLIALPALFFFLPADYFDNGASLCPSKQFLNMECPGCGMTRSVQHLIHLDIEAAWQFNKLTFLILPILGFFYVKEIKNQIRIIRK